MKLIVSQYLASLKERNELDAILPDLLSQLGLVVISRPRQGTRQDGVDVAAVGSLDGSSEKVYLFSIKAGDLTRTTWDGDTVQSLRPSLNEILDVYIPGRIPDEHQGKDIVICLCFGGEIQEQVRLQVEGYIKQHTSPRITFEEWNGDRLASYILSSFLQENLLPENARSELRKSLALLNEPESSYQYFSTLVKYFSSTELRNDKDRIKVIRQINICLWILFAWSRDVGNLEAAYLASELSLLHAWEMAKGYFEKSTKAAKDIQSTFQSILNVYLQIATEFLNKNIIPHTSKRHALSTAVRASCSLDVNLKLFDMLGRLAIRGIWAGWLGLVTDEAEIIEESNRYAQSIADDIKHLISNNPSLLLPIKDDQAIDISIAIYLLAVDRDNHEFIIEWLSELVDRASFSYHVQSQYPCILRSYNELLEHPQHDNDSYSKEVTAGSILFPMIALWAALLGNKDLYTKVQTIKETHLKHCNFQFWYPDDGSEEHFYKNSDIHGSVLSHVCITRSMGDFLKEAFDECEHSPQFNSLSAIKNGLLPIIIIACRHYRLPIPLHLFKGFYEIELNQ
jgi:hypothetical protein